MYLTVITAMKSELIPGTAIFGFDLVTELGRGSFARVFLARQADLANRHVVLKVARCPTDESQTLARLQHTNIVPIFSAFHFQDHSVICMPFLGTTTLSSVFAEIKSREKMPTSGEEIAEILEFHARIAREELRNPADFRPPSFLKTPSTSTSSSSGPASTNLFGQFTPDAYPSPPSPAWPSPDSSVERFSERNSVVRYGDHPSLEDSENQVNPAARGYAASNHERASIPYARSPFIRTESRPVLEALRAMSYTEAVLWLVGQLADGLIHAHDRGILHRDLKPSNILWAEDGQPMLLDFNVAEDVWQREDSQSANVGGTLEYMAPENLEVIAGERATIDGRADVYSLGVILHQFLTLTPPSGRDSESSTFSSQLESVLKIRAEVLPNIREINPGVTPAVEAIILKCLNHDLWRRYQSARELREDIDCQLNSLPLKHAPNTSPKERFQKWARRHPRLSSWSTALAASAVVCLGLATFGEYRAAGFRKLQAQAAHAAFAQDLNAVQFLMTAQLEDLAQLSQVETQGQSALARYGWPENPAWWTHPFVQRLAPTERDGLTREVGLLFYLMARAGSPDIRATRDAQQRVEQARHALDLNTAALQSFPNGAEPSALWWQRSGLLTAMGRADEAERCRQTAKQRPPKTALEKHLAARELFTTGRYKDASPLLVEATRENPRDVFSLFLLARCQEMLDRPREASGLYSACLAIWPDSHQLSFNRGLAHYRASEFREALADFQDAIRKKPNHPAAYIRRAMARQALGQHAEAIADLDQAEALGSQETRIHFLRAANREALGDKEAASRERAAGLAREPSDEASYLFRGYARIASDPQAALADFDKALERNPNSEVALQNKSHLLSEKLGRTAEAVAVIEQLARLSPEQAIHRADHGVLIARLGRREEALRDAQECARRSPSADVLYRVGCIHALTAGTNDQRKREAVRLLATAVRQGYGGDLLAIDHDLDPIRDHPDFIRLRDSTDAIQQAASALVAK